MKDDILDEIHKYDSKKYTKKYNIDLWSIVYLLQKGKFIKFSNTIFSIKEIYQKKYYNEILKKSGDSDLNTKNAIEKELQELGLLTKNENIFNLTPLGIDTIKNLYIDVNGKPVQKIEKFIKLHPLFSFIITLLTFIISLIGLLK